MALLLACSSSGHGAAGMGGSSGASDPGSSGQGGGAGTTSSDAESGAHTSGGDETGSSGETGQQPVPTFDLPALVPVNDGRFATSDACTDCHTADGKRIEVFANRSDRLDAQFLEDFIGLTCDKLQAVANPGRL